MKLVSKTKKVRNPKEIKIIHQQNLRKRFYCATECSSICRFSELDLKSTMILPIFIVFLIYSFMENIRDSMSGNLFSLLVSCILYLALILFSFDQSTVIDMKQFGNFFCFFTYLIIGYLYCHFSEKITINSFRIHEYAYRSSWNKMTMQQQKAIMLIIGQSQREFRLTGLGLIDCSLATFLEVKTIF